jgi:hypothetical protein
MKQSEAVKRGNIPPVELTILEELQVQPRITQL